MEYNLSDKPVTKYKSGCLVVLLNKEQNAPASLPDATRAQIDACIKRGDFAANPRQTLLIAHPEGIASERLLLVGSGVKGDETLPMVTYAKMIQAGASAVAATGAKDAAWLLDTLMLADASAADQLRETVRLIDAALYRFDQYRSQPNGNGSKLKKWTLLTGHSDAALKKALANGKALAAGVSLARDLGNQPPNVCFPAFLSDQARELAQQYAKLKVSVISEKQAEKMGMGAFCAVARGSEHDGQIIVFEYQGSKDKPVALVGKGITFDTGGISLKPGAAMDEMKYDMCGAASVFGTVKAVCELDLPIHLIAVVAAAENMPDGRASRPGDIVRTLSGQTVEILNTDAEGRLVLCDALTYVQNKFKPTTVIDIATLTGACVVALGSHAQAVYANDEALQQALLAAGSESGDRGWPMPLWDDYQEQLDSPFADMANIGGPKAGSVTAACFLSRFTKDVKWAHLDIAGTAWISGGKIKGATGRPVPLLTRYLMNLASS